MKLKKLLAAAVAAALAVTTMAVTSFTASAEDEPTPVTIYQYEAAAVTTPTEYTIDKSDDLNWASASSIVIKVYGEQAAGSDYYGFYAMDTTQYKSYATTSDDTGCKVMTIDSSTNLAGTNADSKYSDDSTAVLPVWKATSGIKLGLMNYGSISKITVTIDGGSEVAVYDVDNLPNGWVCGVNGDHKEITPAKLAEYGVTKANIADCTLDVTFGKSATNAICGLLPCTDNWSGNFKYVENITGTSTTVAFDTIDTQAENVMQKGLRMQFKNCVISKIVLNVPASAGDTPSVTLAPATASVAVGATKELTVTKANADGYTFTVASSDAEKATAVIDGTKVTVTGVAAGTATITVTGTKTDEDPITATCAVTVTAAGSNPPAGKTHEGSVTPIESEEYPGWFDKSISKSDLLGDLDPTKTTIVFTGTNLTKVGYNSISVGDYKGVEGAGTITIDASDIAVGDNYFLHVGGTSGAAVTWVATEGGVVSEEHTTHTGGTATCQSKAVCSVCGAEYGELAAHTYVNGACSVCGAADPSAGSQGGSVGGGSTSTPTTSNNPAPVSQATVVDNILATPDGGKSTINLGSSTKVNKLAIEAIATKGDVTIKLSVAGGAYWEINGKNVTDAKDVNLGVKVNSKLIPESKVEAFAGDKTTIQLSLSHNGDLGFTGTLNVPVGNSNNGKFANLYYYHNGKFDFVGSSAIKGGRTQFAFSHASNYLIVIDDYAYGEDVSSAAGMTETAEANPVPYAAILITLAAFGTSAIVLKKRLSK